MGRKQNIFVSEDERKPQNRSLTREGAFTIVLVNPRIPQNTGAIARMCAATGSRLDLINPFFKIDDAKLKRAGLDYWPLLDVRTFDNFQSWSNANPGATPWLVEVTGTKIYADVNFTPGDFIFFGDEQDGISESIVSLWPDRQLRIPQQSVRSMNLAMSVGVVCFEALRQVGWLGLK